MAIWPFGRRRNADEPTPEPDAGESASPTAGEADVARPERVPTGDWMTVPPVRTSMSPAMPTTFRVQTLPAILTSHQDTRLSSSLGHAVSSDAPSGVIGGLASATSSLGAVSHEGTGGAPSELHEPSRPAKPDVEPPMPMQRRLAAATDAPLAVSAPGALGSMAPAASALPEPAVSRVLASPGPMPSPAALGANPLPVARVVDTTSAGAPTPSPAAATSGPSPAASTNAPASSDPATPVDDRVGGFEVDLTTLIGGDRMDDDLPVITPPADLAPPIQRSVRRDSTPPTLRAPVQRAVQGTSPAPASPAPPTLRPASETTSSTGAGAAAAARSPEGGTPEAAGGAAESVAPSSGGLPPIQRLATTSGPLGARPTVGGEALGSTPDEPLSTSGSTATSATGDGPDLPLAAPPVQRAAEPGGAGDDEHFPGDGHDHGDEAGAVQRVADATMAPPNPSPTPTATPMPDDAEVPATAPLAGEDPLTPVTGGAAEAEADASADAPASRSDELPLVARTSEPGAPTLGTDEASSPNLLPLQTLSDNTVQTRTDGGASSLPLAPPEQPGTLVPPAGPPAPPASATSTGLIGDGPLPTVAGVGTSSAPLTAQRSFDAGPAGAAPRPSSAAGSGPLVAPRPATSAAGATPSATAPALRPLASSAGSLLLATPGSSSSSSAGANAPMTVLGAPPAGAPAVPLQRSFDGDTLVSPDVAGPSTAAGVGTSSSSSGPLPLARSASPASGTTGPSGSSGGANATTTTPVIAQRAVEGSGGSAGRTSMPLHTAAAAVPSTTDLLVRAGLGEKAPDGSFLRSTPPAGVESSFTVQTMPEGAATSSPATVQRAVQIDELDVSPVSRPETGSPDGGGSQAADIRKLYQQLRAELEADLRRQLEAKSRYNRYRP